MVGVSWGGWFGLLMIPHIGDERPEGIRQTFYLVGSIEAPSHMQSYLTGLLVSRSYISSCEVDSVFGQNPANLVARSHVPVFLMHTSSRYKPNVGSLHARNSHHPIILLAAFLNAPPPLFAPRGRPGPAFSSRSIPSIPSPITASLPATGS